MGKSPRKDCSGCSRKPMVVPTLRLTEYQLRKLLIEHWRRRIRRPIAPFGLRQVIRARRRYQRWLWSSPNINEVETTRNQNPLLSYLRGNMGKLANKIFARAVSKLNLPFVDLSNGYANNSK